MARRDVYEDQDAVDTEERGEGLTYGLVIVTTLVLLVAFVVMQMAIDKHFPGKGLFGGETTPAEGSP